MIPYFGITGAVVAGLIAWRLRSFEAWVCVAALSLTMLVRLVPVPFPVAGSAIWCLAGLVVMGKNSLIGTLYGLSGLFYLMAYIGFEDSRYAVLHIGSDLFYILGLAVVVWTSGGVGASRVGSGRMVFGACLEVPGENMASVSKADWVEK